MSSPLLLAVLASMVWALGMYVDRLYLRARHRGVRHFLDQELVAAERNLRQLEKEQSFHSEFLRQFPHLCQKLSHHLTIRQLPGVLLDILDRIFSPALSIVVLHRRQTTADGRPEIAYYVVATSPESSPIERGTPVLPGNGELGHVIAVQKAMAQEDFAREVPSRPSNRADPLSHIHFDLAAPLVFADETIGLIAASGTERRTSAGKEIFRLVAQIAAITYHNVSAYRQMERSAHLDRMTGILNKASITKRLSAEIVEADQRQTKLSVFLFDIDNFKHYNDTNGHLQGDELLATLAGQVRAMTRSVDSCGRFGGEEFLLVLPETDGAGAMVAAEKVRRSISQYPYEFADKQPLGCISVSGGVATYPDDARDSTRLLRLADEALYTAKKAGRNQVKRTGTW